MLRRPDDVTQKAAPLHEGAFNVALAERFGEQAGPRSGVFDDRVDHFAGARAIVQWDPHVEVTGQVGAFVDTLAEGAEAPAVARIVPGKTWAGAEVRKIEDEFIDGIIFVLECGGDGQPFTVMKETEENAPLGGNPRGIDEAEPVPGVGG